MIHNPVTGRKVKKNGTLGKTLVNDYKNHKESGNLKIVKKIESHPVPNFIQTLKKKISNLLNSAKNIVNKFLLTPSLKLWRKATKALYDVFIMAINFLGKLNIFSRKVKDEHIQKGGGIGTFFYKAGKAIILFPFRVIYRIIAEAIRFVRDIMVNCISSFLMILLVLIVLDESIAAFRSRNLSPGEERKKGLIRQYAWIGVVKASGADKMEENKGKKPNDIGWAPVAKKIIQNSKKSISEINWHELYKKMVYIFSPSENKQSGGNYTLEKKSESNKNIDNKKADDDNYVKQNIKEIRKLSKELSNLKIRESLLLREDSNLILQMKTIGCLMLSIISLYGYSKVKSRGKKITTVEHKRISPNTQIIKIRNKHVHHSTKDLFLGLGTYLGFIGSASFFLIYLKEAIIGTYSHDELNALRDNFKSKEKQLIYKINNLKTPNYLQISENNFQKYQKKIIKLLNSDSEKLQKFIINYFKWIDFLQIKYSNKKLKAYIISPLNYKKDRLTFEEINNNNYSKYAKKIISKKDNVFLHGKGYYLILDDKFTKFLDKK